MKNNSCTLIADMFLCQVLFIASLEGHHGPHVRYYRELKCRVRWRKVGDKQLLLQTVHILKYYRC